MATDRSSFRRSSILDHGMAVLDHIRRCFSVICNGRLAASAETADRNERFALWCKVAGLDARTATPKDLDRAMAALRSKAGSFAKD